MRTRKRVWIDFTYYEPGNSAPISAFWQKQDADFIPFIREADAKKEIAAWKLSAETWKKSFNALVKAVAKRKRR